jgi:hypothetical protein
MRWIEHANQTFEDGGRALLNLFEPAGKIEVHFAVGAAFAEETLQAWFVSYGKMRVRGWFKLEKWAFTAWVKTIEQTRQARRFRPWGPGAAAVMVVVWLVIAMGFDGGGREGC